MYRKSCYFPAPNNHEQQTKHTLQQHTGTKTTIQFRLKRKPKFFFQEVSIF